LGSDRFKRCKGCDGCKGSDRFMRCKRFKRCSGIRLLASGVCVAAPLHLWRFP
jgi:hypothetical protein